MKDEVTLCYWATNMAAWDTVVFDTAAALLGLGLHVFLCRRLAFFDFTTRGGSDGAIGRLVLPAVVVSLVAISASLTYLTTSRTLEECGRGSHTIFLSPFFKMLIASGGEAAGWVKVGMVHGILAGLFYAVFLIAARSFDVLFSLMRRW
jgi:hypothetical protein